MKNLNFINASNRFSRILWPLLSVLALLISWALWRYPLFSLHGNHDWGFVLLIFGLIVIAIAAIKDARNVMISVPIGYLGGFFLGIIIDPQTQGGGTHTPAAFAWWIDWAIVFFAVIAIGIVGDLISRAKFHHTVTPRPTGAGNKQF